MYCFRIQFSIFDEFCQHFNLKYLCKIIIIFKFKNLKLFILYYITLIIIHHVVPFFILFYCLKYLC